MTSPLDRAALSDALASATADDLREDAEVCRSALAYAGNDRTAALLQRLAALALAVAAMQERGDARVEQALTGGDFLCTDTPIHGMPYGGCDLMSALAALLKGDQ